MQQYKDDTNVVARVYTGHFLWLLEEVRSLNVTSFCVTHSAFSSTMDSVIEIQRQTHEEIERFERALYTLLSRPNSTHDRNLQNEHKASQMLDRITSRVTALNGLYLDEDARKVELDALSAPSQQTDLSEFYSRLVKIQEHHNKYPDALPVGFDLEIAAFLDEPGQDGDEEFEEEDRKFNYLWLSAM
jgi:splicing factor 3A subunit 3